jgi:hypothetical protein
MTLADFGGPWRIELHDDGHGVLHHGEQDVAMLTLDHEQHSVTLEFADAGDVPGTEWRTRFMTDAERWLRADENDGGDQEPGADAFTEFLYLLLVRAQESDEPSFDDGDAADPPAAQ